MKYNVDIQKHLGDYLDNRPEDAEGMKQWDRLLSAYKIACLMLGEGPKIEKGLVDDIAFYDFEDRVIPYRFVRGNYIGSVEFGADGPWQEVVVSWISWLADARFIDEEGEEIVMDNMGILQDVLVDPEVLNERPYPFLGHHQHFGQEFLAYEDGKFFIDSFYHFSSNSDKNAFNASTLRTLASDLGGGIIGVDRLEHRFDFFPDRARQITVVKLLKMGDYSPLTKEQMLQTAKDKGIDYHNTAGLSFAKMSIPHRQLPIHKPEDFEEIIAFLDHLRDKE